MWFTRVSIVNPVLAVMAMLALVVLGVFSYQKLSIDQFPNVDFPVVVVSTAYAGAAPEIVETEVSKKIEEALNSTSGLRSISSRSYEGMSVVIAEFELSVNSRKAAEDVREKVALIRPMLRSEVEESRVQRFDPSSTPIWSIAVLAPPPASASSDAAQALHFAATSDWVDQVLVKRLQNVRGVGAVNVAGSRKRQITLALRPEALRTYGISADQVLAAVRSESQDSPLGSVRSNEQERTLQIQGNFARPEDYLRIIVARKAGSAVRVADVAELLDAPKEVESLALYNGQRTVVLSVQKAQDENTIAVVDALSAAVEKLQSEVPPGMRLALVRDGSRSIRASVNNVRRTLIEGAGLTILIVFLFLNSWRSTVITGLALPVAIIGTFFFMQLWGFTLNMITLMALSLCVGLLIDDAIVVRENIVRHVQMGKTPRQAALDGTQEIGLAVLATTLSIVAVFLPIGFMEGIIGKFFHQFGLTVVAAVSISMLVSFTLDPMLSSLWHDPAIDREGQPFRPTTLYDHTLGRLTHAFNAGFAKLSLGYQRVLGWSLAHKGLTMLVALLVFISSVFMVRLLGTEFTPKADFAEISLAYHTPAGSAIEITEAKARQVDSIVRAYPEVQYTLSTINSADAQGKSYVSVYIRLVTRKERTQSADAFAARLRERLRPVAGITVTNAGVQGSIGGAKQMEMVVLGSDLGILQNIGQQIATQMQATPGLVDVDTSPKAGRPNIQLHLRPDTTSDLGLSYANLAAQLRTLIAGSTAALWSAPNGQNYDVVVQLAAQARNSVQDLAELPFSLSPTSGTDTTAQRSVTLSEVGQLQEGLGPSQINRRNLQREINISANVFGSTVGEANQALQAKIANIALPPGYQIESTGSAKNMQESFGYAVSALAMAVIFIYMILASQFKSFLQPIALMMSLPMTLIGVVLALLLFGSTLSMFSVIGIVMLMGLVTKNAILLVDYANRQRALGMDREAALIEAAKVRLRPILMTTSAMVFGMVPLAFALSEGAEQRAPMGQAVIGGVLTSSLLTLVVVPVAYCYLDQFGQWLRRTFIRYFPPAA